MTVLIWHNPLGDNPHGHKVADDWDYGDPENADIRRDPRWLPSTYTYFDADITQLWVTQVPICDDEALDYFTSVSRIKGSNPRYVWVKRPGEPLVALPWTYDAATDTFKAN